MKIYRDVSLKEFDFWAGAKDRVKYFTEEELDIIESILEDLEPDGMSETDLNDLFWFEEDLLAEWLGYNSFEELMDRGKAADPVASPGSQQKKEVTIMAKTLGYQVIEDNGGGLHLAVFDGDECIYYAYGYEHHPDNLLEDIAALQDGTDPVQDGWESDLPDGYTPQQLYDELTSRTHGWQIIADDTGVYPERMGFAGRMAFGLDD